MINVLIVDDEPFIREGLKILINWEEYGFIITGEATNGTEAISLLEDNNYDLIITDIKMPEVDGIELVEYIRNHKSKDVKIIILSGYYEFEYAKQAIRYNVVDYILKPIKKEELIRVLLEFKEVYSKEMKSAKDKEYTEQIALERHLNALCSGIYSQSDISYVKEKLKYCTDLRYMSIEIILNDENFQKLNKNERRKVLKEFCETLKSYISPYEKYVFLDVDKRNEIYGIGFIYTRDFSAHKKVSEKQYIVGLQEYVKANQKYKFNVYIGQKVDCIDQISESFRSAVIAKSFQNYNNDKAIAYYEETSTIKSNTYGIKKEYMDKLIHYTEENVVDKIDECVEKIYLNFKIHNIDPKIININIDYLLCRFIYLAKELDPEVDQEEVLHYISQCAFEESAVRGSAKHFKAFVKDFANYLAQLRQTNSHGVLKEVEREIEMHYMQNLSLKSLSEKYYINSAYLGQIFKKNHGISFKDYLNNYRIEKAGELLIRTNDKVCNIAQIVGYNNLDYFINKFVRLKGKTPLQYRKQFLKKTKEDC